MPKLLLRPGLCPDPAGGAYSAPQTLAGFKGPTSKGRRRRRERRRRGGEGRG